MKDSNFPKKIASIIVTFNPVISELASVLTAHIATTTNSMIIVDNGSKNQFAIYECIKKILKGFPFEWIPLDINMGLGAALNKGIIKAESTEHTHIILFDQDTVVPNNLVTELAEQYTQLASSELLVGAIGPAYTDPRTKSEYPQSLINGCNLKKVWPSRSGNMITEVSFIITSGTFSSIRAIRKVGLMREDFFIDCIDIEWCLRARYFGFRSFVTKAVKMEHTIGDERKKSLGREISIHSPLRRYYIARNSILLARIRHIPIGFRLRIFTLTLVKLPLILFDVGFKKNYVDMILKGVFDGLLGRSGPYRA